MHRFALGGAAGRGVGFGGGFGGRGAAGPPVQDACTASAPAQPAAQPAAGRGGRGGRGGGGGFGRGAGGLQPGQYTVRLTVDGQTYTQPVTVKPDPRGGAAASANPTEGNQ
jgi:hypothetical protein